MNKTEKLIALFWQRVSTSPDPGYDAYILGNELLKGKLAEGIEVYAHQFYEKSAYFGFVSGIFNLGMCYRWGQGGVYADPEKALEYFRKAAEKGHERAKNLVDAFDSEAGKRILLSSAMQRGGNIKME